MIIRDSPCWVTASHCTLLEAHDVSRELAVFALDCAEHVLFLWERDFPQDQRPHSLIRYARDYLAGNTSITDVALAFTLAQLAEHEGVKSFRNHWSAEATVWAACAAMEALSRGNCNADWPAQLAINKACAAIGAAAFVSKPYDHSVHDAEEAERKWQEQRLNELILPLFSEVQSWNSSARESLSPRAQCEPSRAEGARS